jgi:hypothetical protein
MWRISALAVLVSCGGMTFEYGSYNEAEGHGFTSRSTGPRSFVVTYYGHRRMPRGLPARWAIHRAAEIAHSYRYAQFAAEVLPSQRQTGRTTCRAEGDSVVCVDHAAEIATVSVRLLEPDEASPGDFVYSVRSILWGNKQQ